MVAHNAPALLLLRFFLPTALLFASCFTFTLPSFGFFVAFLVQHYHPKYEVTVDNFPTVYLILLAVYSSALIIAHIVLAALNTSQNILSSHVSLAKSLGVPDYLIEPWPAVKLLIAPLSVLVIALAILNSSIPNGGGRYVILKRRKNSSLGDASSETSESSRSTRPLHVGPSSTFELEMTPASLKEETVERFSRYMAGHGGIFWTTIACGFTGLSYSSILTLIYLSAFSLVVVVWAFHSTRLQPGRYTYTYLVVVKWFRAYMILYLIFLCVLQNPVFIEFMKRQDGKYSDLRDVFRLVGFVILDTREDEGWAYITGFCFAIATYVFSGIFVDSLSKVLQARNSTFSNPVETAQEDEDTEEHISSPLTYYDTQFLQTVLHLSSIGLLTWSLVFPGILTLPMLFSALAYFASKRVRASKVYDRIIVYAICLQIAHFLFVAILTSFQSLEQNSDEKVIRLLGLRKFQPQFTMNLVQALALGLFCTNIFCKRYISESLQRNSRESELNVTDFLLSANYSATALKQQPFYSVLKLVVDGLSLASLFVAAGTHATILNSIFLLSLVVLCVFQAFGGARAPKVMLFLWTVILAYSTAFLIVTCTACRAIEQYSALCQGFNNSFVGLKPANNVEVVAYTAAMVLSAVQVHFTWAETNSSAELTRDEFKSKFWKLIRKYFLFLNYVALLLYPLVLPANFLSYGYVLFLAISIVVELLGPYLRRDNRSIRPLIKAYWPTVVVFSVSALVARYIVRFRFDTSNVERLQFARMWIFGFDRIRSIQEFHFTVGDASILIIVSLQGRFFGIESYPPKDQDDELPPGASNVDTLRGYRFSDVRPGSTVPASLTHQGISYSQRVHVGGLNPSYSGRNPSVSGSVMSRQRGFGVGATSELGTRPGVPPWVSSRSIRGSHTYEESVMRRNAVAERERLHLLTEKIKIWRQSLPVMQTESFLESVYSHGLILVRNSLLHYSFVLEACAILAAAVWLPGFSVFGAVYTIIGCVLLLSEQAVYDSKGLWNSSRRLSSDQNSMQCQGLVMRMLPIVLAILSFTLMSLQYVYFVASKIRATELNELVYIFEYFGLRTPTLEKLPIDEPAMIAHVLVFVTAFLQRVAVKWAARDAKKKQQEEIHHEGFNRHFINQISSHQALESAVNINQVLGWSQEVTSDARHNSVNAPNLVNSVTFQEADEMVPAREPLPPLNIGNSARFDSVPDEAERGSNKSTDSFSNSDTDRTNADFASKVSSAIQTVIGKMKFVFWDFYSLLNPFWLMWGFDITFMYLVVGGAVTRTSFAVIYLALVMAISGCRRARIARHWHHITLLLACLVLLQYFMTLRGPERGASPKPNQSGDWSEWLYVDKRNNTIERKYDVTFAFLAVICASMTLNAVSPGCRGCGFWFKRYLTCPEDENPEVLNDGSSPELSEMKENEPENIVSEPDRKSSKLSKSLLNPSKIVNPADESDSGTRGPPDEGNENPPAISHDLWERHPRDEDFTTRPMNAKNLIKLFWMRFSGSLVQLYMFAVAVSVTSVFNGVLLLLSFFFLFNFTNVKAKRSYFFIVRFYVLSIVFILVVYQAPFPPLTRWAEVLGLYKTDADTRTGELLLSLMVSLWLICQMQGRIYESKSFKYVVKYGEEDAEVRFKRAVHDHNTRKYERMQGRNKNRRAKMAREQRLDRLKKLRTAENRSVDRLYQVCVVDEMKVLRANAESRKEKGHIFSSHVAKTAEEESPKESKLRVFLRFLFRGNSWKKYRSHPIVSEFRFFMSRYSAWAVYSTMLLATIVNPTELTAVYPLVLFLYLIVEQPRPPKIVWQFLMSLVCFVITGKYVVREWHGCHEKFFVAEAVETQREVCRMASGIFFDILVFLALLWHRTILYNRGLWDLQSSEEDMLLTNEIHGERVETDPSMVLNELPEDPDSTSRGIPSPISPVFSRLLSSDSQNARSSSYNRVQQCNDVFEVLKRSRNKLSSMVGLPETAEYWQPSSEEKNPRERLVTFQSGLSQSESDILPPRTPTYAPLGELNRFFSVRGSRTRTETGSTETLNALPKQIAPAQHAVQQSLLQSNVIPQIPDSNGPSRSLSLFRTKTNSGFIAGIMEHFRKLTKEQEHKAVGDYYILIFLVDFLSFVFVTFGFSSIFGEDTFRLPWWRANFIEIVHLLTLMAMFLGLVIDRVVYLTRSMRGKLALQYVSVVTYHAVIFFLPRRKNNIRTSALAKIFYMLRCVYFLLSGLQIRNGFPKYTTAQFLLRNYNTPGIIMFEIYNFIPFLWLMRTLLDWAVVPTSLEIFQYFRFVDIYIWLYRNRAVNTARGCFRRKLGQQRRWLPRVYQGFGIFLLCAIALFLPFLFFSVLNPFTSSRRPDRATARIDLLVSSTANKTSSQLNNVTTSYNLFTRTTFIGDRLEREEVNSLAVELDAPKQAKQRQARSETYLMDFGPISDEEWELPARSMDNLVAAMQNVTRSTTPTLVYQLTVKTKASREEFKLDKRPQLSMSQARAIGESIASQRNTAFKVNINLPVYAVLDSGSAKFRETPNTQVICVRHLYTEPNGTNADSVWTVQPCNDVTCLCTPTVRGISGARNRFMFKVAVVSHLQVGGTTILTLYAAILFTLANFMRGFFSDKRLIIPYIDMPYTLHLYQLVLDIMYARQDNDLEMEEILYNGLTDIYRDQHVLAKWSGERALKLPLEWWENSEYREAYYCYPSFANTETEPHMTRLVE